MGRIFLIALIGLLVSCHAPQKVAEAQPQVEDGMPESAHHEDGMVYLGEVQLLDCGTVIQIANGETNYKYSPTNLDPKFKTDKLRIKLKFKVLDTQATECSEFRAIEITEAFAVR